MAIPETYKQYGQIPFFYTNGLGISNDATTPLTKLDVAVGTTIDSTETFQLELLSPVVINAAVNGLNGLDTGTLAASKVYAVFLVADPVTSNLPGCMLSLSYTQPLLPFGYSAFKLIGYVATDAAVHLLKGYWTTGNGSYRLFMYDAPQATAVTAGASATYANVDLTPLVPLVNNTPVYVLSDYTPSAASQTLNLTPGNGTGNAVSVTSQVTGVHVTSTSLVMAQTVAISSVPSPVINYKLTTGGAVAISVVGYEFFI
jgi:hypothetical protein